MEHSKAITKKLKDEIFIWDPTAYSNKGYWYVLGTTGAFGRPASKAEAKKLGKPPKEETQPVAPEVIEEAPETKEPKKLSKSAQYRKARRDRRTPFGEMIFKKVFEEGEGLGSAIKSSVSDKFKADITSLKEKFDPLNIDKGLFGNKLGAIIGRKLGRDEEDINYFTGYGSKAKAVGAKNTKVGKVESDATEPLYSKVTPGNKTRVRTKESVANVLAKLYNLIKGHHDLEIKENELHRIEQRKTEELKNHWNKELIEALTGKKAKEPDLPIKDFNKFTKDLYKKLKDMAEAIKKGGGSFLDNLIPDKGLDTKIKTKIGETVTKTAGKTVEKIIGKEAVEAIAKKRLPKILLKSGLKKIPGVSLIAGLAFGASRLADGDLTGAALEAGSGALGTVPVAGTAASIAADIAIAGRDIYKEVYNEEPDPTNPKFGERMGVINNVIQDMMKSKVEEPKPEELRPKQYNPTAMMERMPGQKKEETAAKIVENVNKKVVESAPKETATPEKKTKETKAPDAPTTPMPNATTQSAGNEAKDLSGVAKPAPQPEKDNTLKLEKVVSENNELTGMENSGNGSTVVADNSQKINIINQNTDGLLVEELTGVRIEQKDEPTLYKIMRQNLRMV